MASRYELRSTSSQKRKRPTKPTDPNNPDDPTESNDISTDDATNHLKL